MIYKDIIRDQSLGRRRSRLANLVHQFAGYSSTLAIFFFAGIEVISFKKWRYPLNPKTDSRVGIFKSFSPALLYKETKKIETEH